MMHPDEKFETEEQSRQFLQDLLKWNVIEYDDIQKSYEQMRKQNI